MKLENHRLQIQFAEPGQVQTQRFDRTAIVTQVTLDGKYTFCTQEQLLPQRRTTNGVGLCGEFVLADAAKAAAAGEWFCKPGVGLMKQKQDGAAYDMWQQYEVQPFGVTARHDGRRLVFQQEGRGVNIEKAFSLEENRLILDICVVNSGEKPFFLQEYQHNFLSLEGLPVSEGYVLELNCDKELSRIEGETLRQGDEIHMPSAVRFENGQVIWVQDMTQRIVYHRSEKIDSAKPYRWTLRHLRSKVSVTEETSFCPTRIDIWSVEHCVCPEFYNAVRLSPGETAHWRRTWTFCD